MVEMKGKYCEMALKNVLQILIYVLLSSFGLVMLKIGTNHSLKFSLNEGNFTLSINYILIIGMFLYALSFITSLIAMKGIKLNIFYPVSAGLVYILVGLLSFFVLHEKISLTQIVGMGIILVGVVIMNIKG